jgi:hypothetical protein
MRRKELTTKAVEPKEDVPVQISMTLPVRQRRQGSGEGQKPGLAVDGRQKIPRITRLMALAIKFQDMVDRGEVRGYADLARLGYVTRARLTQIMNLVLLAPDVQERLLFSSWSTPIQERCLRNVVRLPNWRDQRKMLEL